MDNRLAIAAALTIALVTGCGNGSSGSSPGDRGTSADATTRDAPASDDTGAGDAPSGDDGGDAGGGSACGAGDAGTTGPIPRNVFAATFGEGACSAMPGCCAQEMWAYDPVACRTYMTAFYNMAAQSMESSGAVYDPIAARDCLNRIAKEECTCDASKIPDDSATSFVCNAAFGGTVPPGGACQIDGECATQAGMGAICAGGTTTVLADAGGAIVCVGGKCKTVQPDDPSVPSLKEGAVGDPCAATCIGGNGVALCQPLQPGVNPSQCHDNPAACFPADGVYCDPTSKTCAPLPSTVGANCEVDLPNGNPIDGGLYVTQTACSKGLYCAYGTSSDGGITFACAATNATGPCDPTQLNQCGDTAYCPIPDGGVGDGGEVSQCAPLKANGQPCDQSDNNECQGSLLCNPWGPDGGTVCQFTPTPYVNQQACSGNPNAGMFAPLKRQQARDSQARKWWLPR
jgi:hypothetical protein